MAMNDHDTLRRLLPLAAADALSDAEAQTLQRHLQACTACAAELHHWQALERALKELPTPQAPAALVQRTQARMESALASRAGRNSQPWAIAFTLLFAWALTLAGWPFVRLASDTFLTWVHWGFDRTWFGLVAYATLGWSTAGVAAVLLAMRYRLGRETT
jgi:anti-sigma factor RsiW